MSANDNSSGSPAGDRAAERSPLARWLEPSPPLPVDDVEDEPSPDGPSSLLPPKSPADPPEDGEHGELAGEPVPAEP